MEEMKKLRQLLQDHNISWQDYSDKPSDLREAAFKIERTRFNYKGHRWSVVYGYGTYGYNAGLLEIMELGANKEPTGYKTAEQVLKLTGVIE